MADLQARLQQERIPLELVTGGEVDVLWAQSASDEQLRAASYGGRGTDLLVETPYGELPGMFEDLLFRIRVRGFRILLAHPERNPSFQRDPARLVRLVEGDVLVQLTAASVTGGGRAGKLRRAADRGRPRARDRGRPAPRGGTARRSRTRSRRSTASARAGWPPRRRRRSWRARRSTGAGGRAAQALLVPAVAELDRPPRCRALDSRGLADRRRAG